MVSISFRKYASKNWSSSPFTTVFYCLIIPKTDPTISILPATIWHKRKRNLWSKKLPINHSLQRKNWFMMTICWFLMKADRLFFRLAIWYLRFMNSYFEILIDIMVFLIHISSILINIPVAINDIWLIVINITQAEIDIALKIINSSFILINITHTSFDLNPKKSNYGHHNPVITFSLLIFRFLN